MSLKTIRRIAGWLLLILSLAFVTWGIWPLRNMSRHMEVRPSDLEAPIAQSIPAVYHTTMTSGQGFGFPLPAEDILQSNQVDNPEAGSLELVWPARLRRGDPGLIYLTMQINPRPGQGMPSGELLSGLISGNPVQSIANNLLVETSLKISGLQAVPMGEIFEPIQPGKAVKFFWSIRPDHDGTYSGTIWVHLRFIPTTGNSSGDPNGEIRRPLTAQPIEIQTLDLLGLGGLQARWLGGIGLVLGCFLGLDGIFLWLWKRFQMKQGSSND